MILSVVRETGKSLFHYEAVWLTRGEGRREDQRGRPLLGLVHLLPFKDEHLKPRKLNDSCWVTWFVRCCLWLKLSFWFADGQKGQRNIERGQEEASFFPFFGSRGLDCWAESEQRILICQTTLIRAEDEYNLILHLKWSTLNCFEFAVLYLCY